MKEEQSAPGFTCYPGHYAQFTALYTSDFQAVSEGSEQCLILTGLLPILTSLLCCLVGLSLLRFL